MSIAALAERLREGELSPSEAVSSYLERIERLDPLLNSYIAVRGDEALAEARELESGGGERGPLWGVPLAVKDVIDVAGSATTAASRILTNNVAPEDASCVGRLRRAGAIVLGKLNTHEFAYGALTTSPHFGPARNPWSPERVCGGSSGGSGAAAAADLAAGTLGTDTAGSIRIPACFCGVTGLRPTTGRVPNHGVVPVAWSFDTVGPIARSAEDCALLLQVVAGHDSRDPSTAREPVPPYAGALGGGLRGLRIGVVRALWQGRIDERIASSTEAALGELRSAGAALRNVEIPHLNLFGTAQQAVQFQEATAAHRTWLRSHLDEYGADVRARLLTGLFLPPTTYVLGQQGRRLAQEAFRAAVEDVDLLVAPAMPVLPPRIGEETVDLNGESVPYRLSLIPYNSPWSCVGAPVASVPCGLVDDLPVGLAIVGRWLDEQTVLRAAHGFQCATDWHDQRPPQPVAQQEVSP